MSPHTQVNASPITKITSWLKFLGKNLYLVGCATLCAKSEVMLFKADELGVFQGTQRKLSSKLEIQGPQVDVTAKAQSRVSLPFKVPGGKELMKIEMQVFDDENGRDFPIRINQLTVLSGGLWSS